MSESVKELYVRGELLVAQAHDGDGHGVNPAQHGAVAPQSEAEHAEAARGTGHAPGHGEATHGEAGHGATPDTYLMPHELPNLATMVEAAVNPHMSEVHHGQRAHPSQGIPLGGGLEFPINGLFVIFAALLIVLVVRRGLRRVSIERPGKLQNLLEALLGGLRNFFLSIMGPRGEKYIPYVGSLWLFIWINNLMVLIPGLKAPTSSFKVTFALGVTTFFYVQYNAIKESGFKGWVYHLLGSPTDTVTWLLCPLFLVLEVIGELVKPVSLSLRLFGNIFGEDKLLASFLGMGMMITAVLLGTPHPLIGVPLPVIFYPLVVLTSTIQATVFSLLASIYIVLLLPHEHEHEHGEHEETGHAGPATDLASDSVAGASQV